MSNGINKVIIIGNVGQSPELKTIPGGSFVTTISVATSEKWKDKVTGEMQTSTEWHKITFFGRLAEIAGKFIKKGSKIYVEGRLKTKKWQDKDGNKRSLTEINASVLQMLDSYSDSAIPSHDQNGNVILDPNDRYQELVSKTKAQEGNSIIEDEFNDDIPF